MTSLPVICVITSASCGHCNRMRNSGDIILSECTAATVPGGNCWNEVFFKSLLSGSKFRMYEVHFGPMNFKVEDFYDKIVELNEYVWTGTTTRRIKYRPEYIRVTEAKTADNPEGNLRVVSEVNGKKETGTLAFSDFVATKIPRQIYDYIEQYPSWMFAMGQDWDNSIKIGVPLMAHILGFKTISPGKIVPNQGEKPESVLSYAQRFIGGQKELRVDNDTDESCLRKGYVKSDDSFVIMKTGSSCERLGYRIKSPPL